MQEGVILVVQRASHIQSIWADPPHSKMLLDLLDDIQYSILCYLDVRSLLNLSATCHRFQILVAEKTVWLDALENIRCKRPVPLAYWEQSSRSASASLPLERLRSAVIQAAKLENSWSKPTIRPSRFTREPFTLGKNGGCLRWVWNLGFCGILLVYTASDCFTLLFSATGQRVTFQTGSSATCFDFDVDSQGITLIFNVVDGQREANMEIHRVEFADFAHRLVREVSTLGHVHSNFLEDELAGCILSSGGPTYEIVIVNWCTGKFAKIDTAIEVRHHLTASTTKDRILLAYEGIRVMLTWWYDLDSLRRCIARAEGPEEPYVTMLAPHESRHIYYIDQGMPPGSGPIIFYPTSRGMWTGRQSFLTVYLARSGGASFTYALIPEDSNGLELLLEADDIESVQVQSSLKVDDPKKFKVVSRKSFVYHLPENAILSTGRGVHYLHDFGYQGKHAVWVEESIDGDGVGTIRCRLATFNHEDDSLDMAVSGETSTLIFEDEGFSWNDIRKIQLDDQSGVLICFTDDEIWKLYFD